MERNLAAYNASHDIFSPASVAQLSGLKFQFISTPHPIGNLTELQGELVNSIGQLSHYLPPKTMPGYKGTLISKLPTTIKQKIAKHVDGLKFTKKELSEIDHYIKHNKGPKTAHQLLTYRNNAHMLNHFVDKTIAMVEAPKLTVEEIQQQMAFMTLTMGIPTEVITRPIQNMQIGRKERLLKERLEDYGLVPSNSVKSWLNVDADGDPRNGMEFLLKKSAVGLSLAEIFQNCRSVENGNHSIAEPRISCDPVKKGVYGVAHQIKTIPGVKGIKSMNDIFDPNRFNSFYQEFSQFLDTATYKAETVVGKSNAKTYVNNKVDFIMRVCAPIFIKSNGLVLSDFDSSDRTVIPSLIFIQKAVERHIKAKTGKTVKADQVFLPLCESKESIEGAKTAFTHFLNDIHKEVVAANGNASRLAHIRSIICNQYQKFIYGNFSGPSDLTKDMGGQSVVVIQKSILDMKTIWQQFVKAHPQLNLHKVEFIQEYGVGTSPKRGGGLIMQGAKACTLQGSNLATTNFDELRHALKMNQALNSKSGMSHNVITPFSQSFINAATANHRFFWGEKHGVLTKEYRHC